MRKQYIVNKMIEIHQHIQTINNAIIAQVTLTPQIYLQGKKRSKTVK